ncbi:MAG TPA: hypothetical protein VGG62_06815 [Terracidiphilus sp.]
MNDLPETLEQLSSRVDALEKRVHQLEHSPAALTDSAGQAATTMLPLAAEVPSGEQVSRVFLVLGKAMLGIAGAYVLRALAEAGVVPRLLITAIAIGYAMAWLVAASRTPASQRFAGVLYAATSALILAPMLWELTMRFHVLPPGTSATILGLLVAAATTLSWKKENSPDFSVAFGAAALTALALSVVTHVMIAFLVLLLLMTAVCEYRSIRSGLQGVRIIVAAIADCAVWFLIVIYRNPANVRGDYPALGIAALVTPACLLFLVTATSVAFKTIFLQRRITAFEAVQSMVAFLLWMSSMLFLVPQSGGRIAGMICILFAAGCYAVAFWLFRGTQEPRNFHVFALWSAGLLLAGFLLSFPPGWTVVLLALAAMGSAILAGRLCCTTLECHGIIYLTAAALSCGLLEYSFQSLAGTMPAKVAWSILLVSGCALFCYAAAQESEGEAWQRQALHLATALLAVCAASGLAVQGAVRLLAVRIAPDVFHVALIRTLVLCAIALGLAFAGSRWQRPEMRRIAYAALGVLAIKLLFEDLRHGRLEFIAASIFLFALTLIGVPRLARVHRTI